MIWVALPAMVKWSQQTLFSKSNYNVEKNWDKTSLSLWQLTQNIQDMFVWKTAELWVENVRLCVASLPGAAPIPFPSPAHLQWSFCQGETEHEDQETATAMVSGVGRFSQLGVAGDTHTQLLC